MGASSVASTVVARAATAERLSFPDGSSMTLLADSSATGGKLSVHHTTLRRGAEGASPHHHTRVAEVLYVLRGTVQLLVDDELVEAGVGDLVVIPPGVAHAFAAGPDEDAELLVAVTPGIERFDLFRRFERIATGREARGSTFVDHTDYDTLPDVDEAWVRARSITTPTNTERSR
jgi:mannose-6-phosphate isomerase-like protein (cupin superfamily)